MAEIKITNEDCMDLMKRYPDKYFDLAIVDPPFGIGSYWKKSVNTKNHCNKKWNESIPDKNYFDELFRVSKNQIIWGGNYFTKYLPATNSWIVWDKLMNNNPTSDCELAWASLKIKMTKIVVRWSGALKDEDEFLRIHPTQRPVKLHTQTLQKFANPGDKILDTHLGSGSIAIACHDYGYDLTACELDPDYYKAAMKRISDHQSQLKIAI
jgi:site-specific DNA-methyltransferase (adenine-specific)